MTYVIAFALLMAADHLLFRWAVRRSFSRSSDRIVARIEEVRRG